ncbi:hypothetical protein [Bacillus sp. FJAT-29937]|nr:hypothetical protein [Bacillus sp. FJAT-29937]
MKRNPDWPLHVILAYVMFSCITFQLPVIRGLVDCARLCGQAG